tara:strand:+ start:1009 stop:1167 length:159 start_codon:yes stop_codon:yes gene_type:complete
MVMRMIRTMMRMIRMMMRMIRTMMMIVRIMMRRSSNATKIMIIIREKLTEKE